MKSIIQAIASVWLLSWLALLASHTAPVLSRPVQPYKTKHPSPLFRSRTSRSNFGNADHTLNSTEHAADKHVIPRIGQELRKRDQSRQYTAIYHPSVDGYLDGWEIQVQNDKSLPRLPDNQQYIIGWMKRLEEKPIGQGSQGEVYIGLWQSYGKPVGPGELSQYSLDCGTVVVIKISPRKYGYRAAGIISRFESDYIVKVYGYAIQKTAPSVWKEINYDQLSVVAFEQLQETAEDMIVHYPDFDRIPLIRAIMRGLIDAKKGGYLNMDLKLENIMIKDKDRRYKDATWKIIDWDIIWKTSDRVYNGFMGTDGYESPGELIVNSIASCDIACINIPVI